MCYIEPTLTLREELANLCLLLKHFCQLSDLVSVYCAPLSVELLPLILKEYLQIEESLGGSPCSDDVDRLTVVHHDIRFFIEDGYIVGLRLLQHFISDFLLVFYYRWISDLSLNSQEVNFISPWIFKGFLYWDQFFACHDKPSLYETPLNSLGAVEGVPGPAQTYTHAHEIQPCGWEPISEHLVAHVFVEKLLVPQLEGLTNAHVYRLAD